MSGLKTRVVVGFSLVCLAVPLMAGGDFWEKKPYQNWSADETRRLMEESPWATTLTLSGIQSAITGGDSPNNRGYRGEMETDPTISYNVQFRTAQPIREAPRTWLAACSQPRSLGRGD